MSRLTASIKKPGETTTTTTIKQETKAEQVAPMRPLVKISYAPDAKASYAFRISFLHDAILFMDNTTLIKSCQLLIQTSLMLSRADTRSLLVQLREVDNFVAFADRDRLHYLLITGVYTCDSYRHYVTSTMPDPLRKPTLDLIDRQCKIMIEGRDRHGKRPATFADVRYPCIPNFVWDLRRRILQFVPIDKYVS